MIRLFKRALMLFNAFWMRKYIMIDPFMSSELMSEIGKIEERLTELEANSKKAGGRITEAQAVAGHAELLALANDRMMHRVWEKWPEWSEFGRLPAEFWDAGEHEIPCAHVMELTQEEYEMIKARREGDSINA